MDETKDTGVDYPELDLGGTKYAVKFTRAAIYRLEKAGIVFNPTFIRDAAGKATGASTQFSNIVDVLHIVIKFEGTHDELAEFVYDRRDEISGVLIGAWGKVVLPSLQTRAAQLAAAKTEALQKPN